jgi:hypothetical protein
VLFLVRMLVESASSSVSAVAAGALILDLHGEVVRCSEVSLPVRHLDAFCPCSSLGTKVTAVGCNQT